MDTLLDLLRKRNARNNGIGGVGAGTTGGTTRSRQTTSSSRRTQRRPNQLDQIVEDREEGEGLFSRTNQGTRATPRQNAAFAREFTSGADAQRVLENRPSAQDVRDPRLRDATQREIREGFDRRESIQQDLDGIQSVPEARLNLQRLQATNQGLQSTQANRTQADVAELGEVGATNRSLVDFETQELAGGFGLAQQELAGRQQERISRLEGGLGLDQALLTSLGNNQAASTRAAGDIRSAAIENQLSPLERLQFQALSQGAQSGAFGVEDVVNAANGAEVGDDPVETTLGLGVDSATGNLPPALARRVEVAKIAQNPETRTALEGFDLTEAEQAIVDRIDEQRQNQGTGVSDSISEAVPTGTLGLILAGGLPGQAIAGGRLVADVVRSNTDVFDDTQSNGNTNSNSNNSQNPQSPRGRARNRRRLQQRSQQ